MRRPGELVDRQHPLQPEAALDEDLRIASEAPGIAGNIGDEIESGGRDHLGLCLGPGPRRVEEQGVEAVELGRRQRRAGQVAALRGDAPAKAAGRGGERALRRFVALNRMDLRPRRESEGEGAAAGIEIGNALAPFSTVATARVRAASPRALGCRKAPGGSSTSVVPNSIRGGRR